MVSSESLNLDRGVDFYTQNPVFWTKFIIFGIVGSLSLYPTMTCILWAIPISKGKLPDVSENLVSRLRTITNIELLGFASIPFLATLMARGVGLTWLMDFLKIDKLLHILFVFYKFIK